MATELDHALHSRPLSDLIDRHGLTYEDVQELIAAVRNDRLDELDRYDHIPGAVTGSYRDFYTLPDGTIVTTSYAENLVVDSFSTLLTALCLTGRTPAYSGITYMALGQGSSTWDTGGTPDPSATDTILVSELARKALASVQDIDAGGNVVSTGPTGRLLLTAIFNPGEAIGSIREFGLFGGIASAGHTMADANQGIMVNHITHAVISKGPPSDFTLTRALKLIF